MRLVKYGYLDKDCELVQNPESEPLFQESETLTLATECSLKGRFAFGPNAGKFVIRISSEFGYHEEIPLAKCRRYFSINGFSIHANTSINTHRRDRLEQLIEYMDRVPLTNDRLAITDSGKLRLKRRLSYGTTHLLFTHGEFIEKLTATIPPTKTHLVRWGGVFAPASPLRAFIILQPEEKKDFDFEAEGIGC